MADTNSTVDTLITRENELTSNLGKVAPFAYTQVAYDNNNYAGVDSYAYAQEQNIPSSNPKVLTTNATVLNKGVRGQASSLPRMLVNHFFGRTSYNLNKIHDFFKTFLTAFKRHLAQDCSLYSATNTYYAGDICFILDTVHGQNGWRVFRCVNTSASGITNQPPVIGGVVQTLNWIECKYLTSLGEANGSALLDFSGKLYWNELPVNLIGQKREKKVICIGDSYGINYTNGAGDGWTGWGYLFTQLYPEIETHVGAVGGAGFVANAGGANFTDILASIVPTIADRNSITDIVVLGGYNDMSIGATAEQIKTGIAGFMDYARNYFPNAQVLVSMIAVDYNDPIRQGNLTTTAEIYREGANRKGGRYFRNFKYILRDKNCLFFSDGDANSGFHPNTAGNALVAQFLHEYLFDGSFDVLKGIVQAGAFVYAKNGDITISPVPKDYPVYGYSTFMEAMLAGKQISGQNVEVDLGDVSAPDGNLLWGARSEYTAEWTVEVLELTEDSNNNRIMLPVAVLGCRLVNKHIYVRNLYNNRSIHFGSGSRYKLSGNTNFHFYEQTIY